MKAVKAAANDVLGHASFAARAENAPPLQQYSGRDGVPLSFRFYDSMNKDRVIFLLHGSSAHGEYLHSFAEYLSIHGAGQVVVPNLRGHYSSGGVRGDCAFIGQLEEDLYHFINTFDLEGKKIFLAGHSSGGGLALRYAAGPYGDEVAGLLLLSPVIPRAPTMRKGDGGGWAKVSVLRMAAFSFLNSLGIRWFNNCKVITFNKPPEFCDGRETLSYSYNLYASYHPRQPYDTDIAAIKCPFLLLIGSDDEVNDPLPFGRIFQRPSSIRILEGVKHLEITLNRSAMELAVNWMKG